MKNLFMYSGLVIAILLCIKPSGMSVSADTTSYVQNINLTTKSYVSVDPVFGNYTKTVDENIYYSLSSVNGNTLKQIYGAHDTPMFNMAVETINPCMALATTWGEAGQSWKGISLTTVMDFSPNTYGTEIDWINVSKSLEQVDEKWYITNTVENYNTNEDGYAYQMPCALLQFPKDGNRVTATMIGLGVGPYQITSSDWDKYPLENRVNPIWGFQESLRKCGSSWINCGIEPTSDLTVYACLSLGHQGGGLINTSFGHDLIECINRPDVQQAFLIVGRQMYLDAREKAYNGEISLANINVSSYQNQLYDILGFNFNSFHASGYGSSNKGNYVCHHLLKYVFYKNYFTEVRG